MSEQRVKRYVEVIADFQADGTLIPQAVVWDTGSVSTFPTFRKCNRANTQKPAELVCAIPAR